MLLGFDDTADNMLVNSFILNVICGCSIHFICSVVHVAKVVGPSILSASYKLFMEMSKMIPDEPSADVVMEAFNFTWQEVPFLIIFTTFVIL